MNVIRRISTAASRRCLAIDPHNNQKGFYYRITESVKRHQMEYIKYRNTRSTRPRTLLFGSPDSFRKYPKQQMDRFREFADTKYEQIKDFKGKHVESIKTKGQKGIRNVKDLGSKYGVSAIVTYLSLYIGTLGAIYMIFNTGLVDTASMMQWVQHSEHLASSSIGGFILNNPNAGVFGLSWIATKFTEPLRLVATVAVTPRVDGFLKRLRRRSGSDADEEPKDGDGGDKHF